jgi:hypothetical protein
MNEPLEQKHQRINLCRNHGKFWPSPGAILEKAFRKTPVTFLPRPLLGR